jgi:hypothetical protein
LGAARPGNAKTLDKAISTHLDVLKQFMVILV